MARDLASLIAQFDGAQLHRKALESEAEAALALEKELEWAIIHEMADQRLETVTHSGTTVAPIKEDFPRVEDWDKFWEFIIEHNFRHMIEKRPSVSGYRELLNLGRAVPGVVPFAKTRLKVRRK
jgi:hypothetical protein